MRGPFRQTWGLAGDREEWRAVCDRGLETFEQQHIDVAVAKRTRRHQQRNQPHPTITRQGSACTVCGRVCASAFGLRSHMRRHKETHWAASSSNRRTTKRERCRCRGIKYGARSVFQTLRIPSTSVVLPRAPHFCGCYHVNRWVVRVAYKWMSRFEMPCIPTRWTGERCVEQMSRLQARNLGRRAGEAPLKSSSPPWKNVLDIV